MGAPAPPQSVGRYAIYGKIASGGMASVHFGRLAGAAGFSRTVAIKRLHPHLTEDPDFRSTMIDEARLAARIHHPNVVPMLDVVAANGELLLVMEYVRGESLGRLLRGESARRRRVPLPIASAIVIGALHGLHAAHEATSDRGMPLGIVHRDVSPQNVLVGVDGLARVIDFGIAKAAERLQTTTTGALKGKIAYMAPEQLTAGDEQLATAEVTRTADVYAMGAVLWEALAGKRLFRGTGDAQIAMQVMSGAKEPPSRHTPNLPRNLDKLVMKALARDPAERFASAQEMAEMLLRVVPPAFPTVVGKWVEEVAAEALARRGMQLADIENSAETVTLNTNPPASVRTAPGIGGGPGALVRPSTAPAGGEDVSGVASQPSNLSMETPRRSPPELGGAGRAILAGVLGGSLLLAAGAGAFLWGSASGPGTGAAAVPAAAPPAANVANVAPSGTIAPTPSGAKEEPATPAASESARPPEPVESVSPPSGASPEPSARASHPSAPAKPHPKARPPKPPPAPFRFAQPD